MACVWNWSWGTVSAGAALCNRIDPHETTRNHGRRRRFGDGARVPRFEALNLELIGSWDDHDVAVERLPGRVRPSTSYLTGFLIPSSTRPEFSADADAQDDIDETPASSGLAEESSEERKAANPFRIFPQSQRPPYSLAVSRFGRTPQYAEMGWQRPKRLAVHLLRPREHRGGKNASLPSMFDTVEAAYHGGHVTHETLDARLNALELRLVEWVVGTAIAVVAAVIGALRLMLG